MEIHLEGKMTNALIIYGSTTGNTGKKKIQELIRDVTNVA